VDTHGETHVFEGCMPIEIMAARGERALSFGSLKPVGLNDPRTGKRPHAVVQLRREDARGSMYSLVGFQTNLQFGEQRRVFSMIPGLQRAEFLRYGVMHRNTYINSPALLTPALNLRTDPRLFFAGQLTGAEGYVESIAGGLLAGLNMALTTAGRAPLTLPRQTMMGALFDYISNAPGKNFQPMNANFGLIPDCAERYKGPKAEKYRHFADRSLGMIDGIRKAVAGY